jgi:hypothetical protein
MTQEQHCGQYDAHYSRRDFLNKTSLGLGAVALGSLLKPGQLLANPVGEPSKGILSKPHFAPRAKRVIYLFQSGGPSQHELWDYKPTLQQRNGEELPESVRGGQRLTGMSSGQKSLPMAGSIYSFQRHGESGHWVSELMPHTAKVVDDLCFVKSMYTEAINHDPAATFIQTGSQFAGGPRLVPGSAMVWVVRTKICLPSVCWLPKTNMASPSTAGFGATAFYLPNIRGYSSGRVKIPCFTSPIPRYDRARPQASVGLPAKAAGAAVPKREGDPEIQSRIAQYEMAYRMQTSVPETMDITGEPDHIYDLYGPDSRIPGTYAANCLLARRLAERGVKFIQLYHQGWDQHGNLPRAIRTQAQETDQASAALIIDLKQRGLLDDTLVIWGGEFGRTSYSQGQLTDTNYGRDHHPRCFTLWMAGAGVKPGFEYGKTDDFSYNIVENPVHIHDFQATLLYLLGIDHEKLTYKFQGRRYRLTDVHGKVVKDLLV